MRHGGQEAGLDLGGIVHARGHAVGQQVHQEGLFASRRGLDQFDQFGGLLGADSGSGGMPSAARSAAWSR
jgi:hypothetical protein